MDEPKDKTKITKAKEIQPKEGIYDVVMIGAGPSSLAAAIYTTREELSTLLLEKAIIGGLAAITDIIDNYPGFPEGLTGMELSQSLEKQALRFGAKIDFGTVTKISRNEELNLIDLATEEGGAFQARAALIATGSHYKELGVPGEKEYYGRGVHFCATCDGAFYKDKELIVVGGGNSAVQETIFLTRFATKITIMVRSDKLKASDVLITELEEHIKTGKVVVSYNSTVDEILGEDKKFSSVNATINGKKQIIKTGGVFVFIGLIPNTQFLEGSGVELDEQGFVKTNLELMTNIKGVFSSGDCRSGATMQIASATGEGATAALMIRKYIEDKSPSV